MDMTPVMKAHYALRHNALCDLILSTKAKREQESWAKRGRLGPPHGVKQDVILSNAKSFKSNVFIETGTYLGDMIYAVRNNFRQIYSVELSKDLHEKACASFRNYRHIHPIQGDSATALKELLDSINERCLFWLDGHYSGGITAKTDKWSPIILEIEAIFRHPVKDHVILIDDAVCFNGQNGYPTLYGLLELVSNRFSEHNIQVFDNIVQVTPAQLSE